MSKALIKKKTIKKKKTYRSQYIAGWFCFHIFELLSTAVHFTINLSVSLNADLTQDTFMQSVCAVLQCIIDIIIYLSCQDLPVELFSWPFDALNIKSCFSLDKAIELWLEVETC